jgi:excisionase family DNA binding protein
MDATDTSREFPRDDQIRALIVQLITLDEPHAHYAAFREVVGRAPSLSEWQTIEAMIPTLKRQHEALTNGMTTGDVATLTGWSRGKIRRMADRGEMPAPMYVGEQTGWRFWDRAVIEEWWAAKPK